ncbi:MAG TPA: AzlD domain-containing protein [Solirubrobacteraceae bacterium]|nr:AzlD domain-containing protein [Solirubrobacteraceae bacterium]
MSWWAVLALCGCAYGLKAVGLALADRVPQGGGLGGSLELVVVPVIAALIVVQTVGGDREVVVDARLPAVLVAAVLVWRRAPILVIVLAAGATAALLRHS